MRKLGLVKRGALKIGTLALAGLLTASAAFANSGIISYAENKAAEPVVTEIPGTVSTESSYNSSFLSVTGFAAANGEIHDRSEYIGTEFYRVINNEKEFLDAIKDAQAGKVKVMEIVKDMDLGYKYLKEFLGQDESGKDLIRKYNFVREYKAPSNELKPVNGGFTNPLMEKSGVSQVTVGGINGLTIFSPNASSIKHAEFKISSSDIVIRNLHFKEMWQWDDAGAQKEVGWSNLKLTGCKNVWIDHCTFEIAADGNIDLENGATGVTISWCKIGEEATEKPSEDGSVYQSIMFMEGRYQRGELKPDTSLYHQMRTGGATPEQIMAYATYHKKCHLNGSGDKDFVNYVRGDGEVVEDANSNIKLTLAYNHYTNVGQRVPMIRQGVGNLINCYIDDTTHKAAEAAHPVFKEFGPYSLTRCLNARNGASIAADTCVFDGVEEPITGAEVQGDDTTYMAPEWAIMFKNVYNRSLIVNSTVTNSKGTYTGSSWDNNGDNLFTTGFNYKDKTTVGKWAWASHIVNEDQYEKRDYTVDEAKPMEFTYDTDGKLPYEYQVLPLEDVKEVVTGKSGAGAIEMESAEWLKTTYLAEADYSAVDAAIEKAEALTASDYVDFSAVTAAIEAVVRDLKVDEQAKVDAMAAAIEKAISELVKVNNDEAAPPTGDAHMPSLYILMLAAAAGLAGVAASKKRCKSK